MFKRSYISYLPYYKLKIYLESLLKSGEIEFFMMIDHLGENGGKNHVHLYVESRLRSVDNAVSRYILYDENGPLKTGFPSKSELSNWYWYVLHDKGYLLKKGLKKSITYKNDDVYISDQTYFVESLKDLRYVSPKNAYVLHCLSEGESPLSLYKRGIVTLYEMRLLEIYNVRLSTKNGK